MNAEPVLWNRLTLVVKILLFAAFLLGVGVWYLPRIKENEQYRKDLLAMQEKIDKEWEEGRQLSNQIKALRSDQKTVERVARASLGYAKPGEVVYRFESPPANGFH